MPRIDPTARRLLVTGVGYRLASQDVALGNVFDSPGIKPNIGAAVALRGATEGYEVTIVARTKEKLEHVRESINQVVSGARVSVCPTDILSRDEVARLAEAIPQDKDLDYVQCAGLSAGSYQLPDDNPYLLVEDMPQDLPTAEFDIIVRGLLIVTQAFLPRWRSQSQTRLTVVNSMSGIRPYALGYSHTSAKAGLHHAVRSMALELTKEKIYISEVNPGIVDTGLYDPEPVMRAVEAVGLAFGYDYRKSAIPQMPPSAVADAVVMCLSAEAHIVSVNMVACGQWPHEGA